MLEPDSKWIAPWIGIQQAMPSLWEGFEVWVVEGLFDLFALDWVVPERVTVLSSLKARLTKNHVRFLRRFASSVCMVYDLDEAGHKGTRKALYDLKEVGVSCRSLVYKGGKDPGEIWDRNGVEGLKKSFDTSYYIRGVN
jgi:DNA primase